MKRFILSLFLFLSVISLSSWDILGAPKPNIGRETGMEAAKFIKKKYGVSIAGFGECGHPKYEDISFTFTLIFDSPTIEEVRRLIVPITEDFLEYMNNHPEISEKFKYFPLTKKEVILSLLFTGPKGEFVYSPYIWSCWSLKGKIHYRQEIYRAPQPGVYGRDEKQVIETFEEAKAILETEKQVKEASSKPLTETDQALPLEKPSP